MWRQNTTCPDGSMPRQNQPLRFFITEQNCHAFVAYEWMLSFPVFGHNDLAIDTQFANRAKQPVAGCNHQT
jgi:hypothetical protein